MGLDNNWFNCAAQINTKWQLTNATKNKLRISETMRRLEITPGTQYGDLKVVREAETKGKRHFVCKCACGNQVTVRLGHLTSGHSTTCGKCGIAFQGKRRTIRQWAALHGLNESTLRARLKVMPIGEALKR